jgi:hypothetical protein
MRTISLLPPLIPPAIVMSEAQIVTAMHSLRGRSTPGITSLPKFYSLPVNLVSMLACMEPPIQSVLAEKTLDVLFLRKLGQLKVKHLCASLIVRYKIKTPFYFAG